MFKFVATIFAAILAVVYATPKPGLVGAPVAYSGAHVVAGAPVVSAYSAPVVSHYSAPVVSAYSAPVVAVHSSPLAYSAYRPVAYVG